MLRNLILLLAIGSAPLMAAAASEPALEQPNVLCKQIVPAPLAKSADGPVWVVQAPVPQGPVWVVQRPQVAKPFS